MKRFRGLFTGFCACAIVAAAWGQAPVTQVEPVASPSATPAVLPEAASSPAASPAGSPAAIASGTAAVVSGTMPDVTGTMAASGTAPMVTGTAPMVSGSAAVSGTGTAAVPSPTPPSPYSVELDLAAQHAYLLKDGKKIAASPISSGRPGHLTPTGNFEVIEKDLNHFSNLYGKIVEKGSGRVVKAGADAAMPVPKGCKFEPAPMKWFMRFDGAAGMHAGILPGYAASHGCVRMPAAKAELFYETVEVGTPVHVFGTAPVREFQEEKEAPHRAVAVTPKATPVPAPTPKRRTHGFWWL